MQYSAFPADQFVSVLAAKTSVPGGGGASALAAALGMALGNMVGSFTVGKKKYKDVEEEMYLMKARADRIQNDFLHLIDRDAEVFEPLAKAYSLPSDTPEEKEEKERVLEEVLEEACSVPMEIMEKCCETIDLLHEFAEKGSAMVISDAGVGASLAKAALRGASLNVYVNTKLMKDREKAQALNAKANAMMIKYSASADVIFMSVLSRLT